MLGKNSNIHVAAYILFFFSAVSAVLALLRTNIFANSLGASELLDIWYASFYLPDLVFALTVLSVSLFVLVPELSKRRDELEQKNFIASLSMTFLFVFSVVAFFAFLITPAFLVWKFPTLMKSSLSSELVFISRLLLLQVFLLGVSNILSSMLQIKSRFVLFGLSPVLYSLSIIVGMWFFYPMWGLRGVAFFVLLGAFLHLLVPLVFLKTQRLCLLKAKPDFSTFFKIVKKSWPRTAGLFFQKITNVFLASVASLTSAGALGIFQLAYDMAHTALNALGGSYSTASFATLSLAYANGDKNQFKETLLSSWRHLMFWSMPITLILVLWSKYIFEIIVGVSAFGESNINLLALTFSLIALAIPFQSSFLLFSRAWYAQEKVIVPLVANILFAVLSLFLANATVAKFGLFGVAASVAVGYFMSFTFLFFKSIKEFDLKVPFVFIGKLALSLFILYFYLKTAGRLLENMESISLFVMLVLFGLFAVLLWVFILYFLGVYEVKSLILGMKKRLLKTKE